MICPGGARKLVAVVSTSAILIGLVLPAPVLADGITLNRDCQNPGDSACTVEVAPASAVAVNGPVTGLGPAIELNLAVDQVADAGTAVSLTRSGGGGGGAQGGAGGAAQGPAGAAINGFAVSVGQTGTATATSGTSQTDTGTAQGGGSTAVQNPPSSGSDPGSSGQGGDTGSAPPSQSPPSGGSTSGVNMITTVASVVQIVQVVARNNNNTTIAPIQFAAQCQQAAVSCGGNTAAGHP